jgi:hypothetical protein
MPAPLYRAKSGIANSAMADRDDSSSLWGFGTVIRQPFGVRSTRSCDCAPQRFVPYRVIENQKHRRRVADPTPSGPLIRDI